MRDRVRRSIILVAQLSLGAMLLAQVGGPLQVIQRPEANEPRAAAASPAILANDTLYVSGQGGRNSDGRLPSDAQQEFSQSLDHVRGLLHQAGMDLGNVVSINISVTHPQDVTRINETYWKSIGSSPPARTVLIVGALPDGESVQISCIAVRDTSTRRAIWPAGWPRGPHIDPPAIAAKDVFYLSAQTGADPLTGRLAPDFAGEVKQALDNVATVLKSASMSMANVVFVNPFLTADSPQSVMNTTYATYFEFGNTPARATIGVAGLPSGHIVFSCIAGADLSHRKAIRPKNMQPSPTASPGVLYRDTFYLSAKSGFIPDQGIVTQDVELQLRQTMRNLLDGLQEADMDLSDVVFSTVYLRQIGDADRVHALYATFFPKSLPARSTLQQSFDTTTTTGEQISFIAVKHPRP